MHPNYPIKIIDTPGFENDNSVEYIYKLIEEFEIKTKDPKKRIDLILYFNILKERSLLSMEIDLLKYLMKNNKKIIFILNEHGFYSKKEVKRLKEVYIDSLRTVIESIPDNKNLDLNGIIDNVIVINLKQNINEIQYTKYDKYDDEEIECEQKRIKQSYGMDILFKRIHEMFENEKISINEIQNNLYGKLKEYVEKCELLKHFRRIEDVYINTKIVESYRLINSYSQKGLLGIFFKEKKRKELIEKLISVNSDKYIDAEDFYYKIEELISQLDQKDEILLEYIISVPHLRDIVDTYGIDVPLSTDDHTMLIGCLCMKEFAREYGQYDLKTNVYLKELAEKLNQAIDGFSEISNEWKNVYKSLNEYKSDKEWVNKYFILDFSKYNK